MRRSFVLAILVGSLVAGCGGSGSSSTNIGAGTPTAPEGPTAGATETTAATAPGVSKKTSAANVPVGSPSQVPRSKGGDNSIQDFGSEADSADRSQAGRVLAAYLAAYRSGDMETACALLAPAASESFGQLAARAGRQLPKTCAGLLRAISPALPAAARRQLTPTRILSLRVDGERAFLIYDGADGVAYAIPMAKPGADWRVGGIAPTPLQT